MSEFDYHEAISSDGFFSYDDYFYELAPAACRGCVKLSQITCRFALNVVRDLATSEDGVLDFGCEREVLAEATPRFIAEVGGCPGPGLEDRDPEKVAKKISEMTIFTPKFKQAALANLLPLREACGLDISPQS